MKLLLFIIGLTAVLAFPTLPQEPNPELGDKFEGDIILNSFQKNILFNNVNSKTGLINTSYRWTSNNLIYEFAAEVTTAERNHILAAIGKIAAATCITFTERTTQAAYVYITTSDSGCYSYVGRQGGRQQLNLQKYALETGCFRTGTIMHEFIHALGFYHMQSAYDRDDYVIINWENIQAGTENNFNKHANTVIQYFGGASYDYGSVMHYGAYAFSNNDQPTIVPIQAGAVIGQRDEMSTKDIQGINGMYNC